MEWSKYHVAVAGKTGATPRRLLGILEPHLSLLMRGGSWACPSPRSENFLCPVTMLETDLNAYGHVLAYGSTDRHHLGVGVSRMGRTWATPVVGHSSY